MTSGGQEPSWVTALSPYLEQIAAVPLELPIRTLAGDLIPHVRAAVVNFPRWGGAPFVDDLGRKSAAFVELDGEHLFAELAVLRLLEREGWEGRWVTTHGAHGEISRLLTSWRDVPRADQRHVPIEDARARQLLASIAQANKPARYAGCWGVYAWRDGQYVFLECKRSSGAGKDRVGRKQEEWMRMALAAHPGVFSADSFCLVQWDYAVAG